MCIKKSLVAEVVTNTTLALFGGITICRAIQIGCKMSSPVKDCSKSPLPMADVILFFVSEVGVCCAASMTTGCECQGTIFLFEGKTSCIKRPINDVPRRRSTAKFGTAPNHMRTRRSPIPMWRRIVPSNSIGRFVAVRRRGKLVCFMRCPHSGETQAALIRFKPAPVSKRHTTKDLMLADSPIINRSLYVSFAQKAMSVESPLPNGNSFAYFTDETGSPLMCFLVLSFSTEGLNDDRALTGILDIVPCGQIGSASRVTSRAAGVAGFTCIERACFTRVLARASSVSNFSQIALASELFGTPSFLDPLMMTAGGCCEKVGMIYRVWTCNLFYPYLVEPAWQFAVCSSNVAPRSSRIHLSEAKGILALSAMGLNIPCSGVHKGMARKTMN